MKIAVIGTTFVDIKGYPVGKFDPAGRNAGRVETFHGGVGRNIAEDVRSLGADTVFVSLVDRSALAEEVLAHLNGRGINTEFVGKSPDGMGTWLAIFDDKGDVYANVSRRTNLLPMADIIREHGEEIFKDADGVLVEIDMDEPVIEEIFRQAEKYGSDVYAVISNMNVGLERAAYINRCRCLVCNQHEAGIFFGKDTDALTPGQMLDFLKASMEKSPLEKIVVTAGGEGCIYVSDDESGICPAVPANVVDTTGAGDSFFAGCSVGLSSGMSLRDAAALGNRIASVVIGSIANVCADWIKS